MALLKRLIDLPLGCRWVPRLAVLGLAACASTPGFAQVVQLPSTRTFSYTGSAWVPDAGTAGLGGNRYARSSATNRGIGPYGAGATTSLRGGISTSVSVQVIDLKALDDAILSSNVAVEPTLDGVISADSPAASGGRNYLSGLRPGPSTSGTSLPQPDAWQRTMAGARRGVALQPGLAEANIRHYLRRGNEAESMGRINAARVYYRMAIEAMTPDMLARYETIMAERKALHAEEMQAEAAENRKRF